MVDNFVQGRLGRGKQYPAIKYNKLANLLDVNAGTPVNGVDYVLEYNATTKKFDLQTQDDWGIGEVRSFRTNLTFDAFPISPATLTLWTCPTGQTFRLIQAFARQSTNFLTGNRDYAVRNVAGSVTYWNLPNAGLTAGQTADYPGSLLSAATTGGAFYNNTVTTDLILVNTAGTTAYTAGALDLAWYLVREA